MILLYFLYFFHICDQENDIYIETHFLNLIYQFLREIYRKLGHVGHKILKVIDITKFLPVTKGVTKGFRLVTKRVNTTKLQRKDEQLFKMTIQDIKSAWKLNKNVIYNGLEYEIYSIALLKDKVKNSFYTGIVLKDMKANCIIQVDPKKIERIKE